MRIVVTGGSGFIGSAVVRELEALGHVPVVLDHTNGGDIRNVSHVQLVCVGADAVIHLAGVLGTSELFDSARDAVDVNIGGTVNILQECERRGIRYVGLTMPSVWMNVYQATKRCAFEMAEAWRLHRGVRTSYVRAYNVYGPGQKYGLPQKIIPTFAVRSWRREPIPIWGDGTQTVDLVHVDDVAKMLVDAISFGDGELFDAGTGTQHSVLKVAGMVHAAVFGGMRSDLIEYLPMRAGEDPGTRVAAMGEGWDSLNWHPQFDHLRLFETVRSYRGRAHRVEDVEEEMT